MHVEKNIFRNYDIRGTYPDEINEDVSLHLGRALGTILRKTIERPKIVVGRDNRKSSPALTETFINGLLSTGCDVTDVGISVTPATHFFTATENFDMGINITASHNPKEFNGYRMDYRKARSFFGDNILKIRSVIEHGEYIYGEGVLKERDLNEKYVSYMRESFKFKNNPRVVIDCGSGATSELAMKIFDGIGCDPIPLLCEFDSDFPHGVPDPENDDYMETLGKRVVKEGAAFGVAYDTDGDRFGMVDEKGQTYGTDDVLLLFSKHVLKDNPGRSIVYDVKCSSIMDQVISSYGGQPKILRTGHPYFTEEVENHSVLGAEYSGHVYFSDRYFGYDDGIYASLRLTEIMDQAKIPLSEMMSEYPKRFSTTELKVDCDDELKFQVINLVKIYLMNNVEYKKLVDIDGVRLIVSDTGWFLVRASNTSPYLSIRAEGKDEKEKEDLLKVVREALKSVSIIKLDINF